MKKMIASVFCPAKYKAAAAAPKITSFKRIPIGTETGIVAFGDTNIPQKMATSNGVPIPNDQFDS
ncbi:hypothetical protein JOC74_003085 [Bacillus capparidis]|uniref:Uncharacterized protein n=1 Tax=Bacillus capparidis TaxID=1840411 RepID=A0ABS4CYX7_9BACI|nr:hypothetical protein [Bacillus capparidis]